MSLRREKLQELFKEETGVILQRRLRDPRVGFVSVTDVELSGDLRHAKIFVSVLGDAETKHRTMAALEGAARFVRGELGRRVRMRYVPEVLFRLDESIERGARVNALLRQVVPPADRAPESPESDQHPSPAAEEDPSAESGEPPVERDDDAARPHRRLPPQRR
ncbi:MAG TPA: 30S ribosome-binding factor RbfA [bacterium]|jgi:ribosome-binding factor A|nr:30S ribosome-binding factor RbfA [bacterium]